MIPKIVHYTWFSGEAFPEKIQKCIDSWKNKLHGYEFVLWDMERIKDIDSIWLKECITAKKWAFAADFVRLYAVYNYGGIYIDTDCLIYKTFDSLLDNKCFIGKENSIHLEGGFTEMYLTSHCFGAEQENDFVRKCLLYYKNRHFVLSNETELPKTLCYSMTLMPYIQSEIAKALGYNPAPSMKSVQKLNILTVYPSNFFDPKSDISESYCKHLAVGAWREQGQYAEKITLGYKIRWRIEYLAKSICNKFGYLLIRKQ